ncbi:MAG: C2H2-type zinc finger protein [Halorientalis sp.]
MTDTDSPTDRADTAGTDAEIPDAYDLPPDADPEVCGYCGAPFADDELLALHRGLDHADAIDAAERDAFEEVYEAEEERLRLFRLQALGALVLLYFGLLIAYSVFG